MPDESGDDDRPREDTDSSRGDSLPGSTTDRPERSDRSRAATPPSETDDTSGSAGPTDGTREGSATEHRRRDAASTDEEEDTESATQSPPPAGGSAADRPRPEGETASNDVVDVVREVLISVGGVLLVGGMLFAFSGVWPPLVAVESGSMEPHMYKGDLVFVAESGRYAPDAATAGVVTHRQGRETGYWSFGDHGNVIVYQPDGQGTTPVIHRVRMYVEAGEDWVQRADPQYLGSVDSCSDLSDDVCPAPHDGYITLGDANPQYDQVSGLSTVVRPEWVRGNAKVRVPKLGCIRLEISGIGCEYPVIE
jgi:signal peptidase